jgi:hypothetical protein
MDLEMSPEAEAETVHRRDPCTCGPRPVDDDDDAVPTVPARNGSYAVGAALNIRRSGCGRKEWRCCTITQLLERKEWLRQDNAAVRVESLGLEMEDPDDFPSEPYTRDGYDSDGYQIDDGSFFVEVQCGPDEVPGVVHVARCGADDRDEGPRKGLYRCHDQTGSDRDEWYPVMVWPRLLLDIHGSGLIDIDGRSMSAEDMATAACANLVQDRAGTDI